MALTYSPAADPDSKCPDFLLPSVDGRSLSLVDFKNSQVLVVMFICNHCPYVQAIESRILEMARSYQGRSVQFLGICANDPTEHPEDSPEELKRRWQEKAYGFPYLIDTSQNVARAFGAVCTPDFFVYDAERTLRYRGRLDDSWKDPARVTKRELEAAITALLANQLPSHDQHPSMGCSIKWREPKGN